jgi:hypothetical protein
MCKEIVKGQAREGTNTQYLLVACSYLHHWFCDIIEFYYILLEYRSQTTQATTDNLLVQLLLRTILCRKFVFDCFVKSVVNTLMFTDTVDKSFVCIESKLKCYK